MSRLRLAYIGFFLFAFLVSLAATMPASYGLRLFGLAGGPFLLLGIDGTVWSGGAARALVMGRDLGTAHWRFRPVALIKGCLGWTVALEGAIGQAHFRARVCPGSTLRFSAVRAEASAARLQEAVGPVPVGIDGRLEADLGQIEVVHDWPTFVRGTVVWRDAAVNGSVDVKLGTLTARIATKDRRIVARLSGKDGASPLEGVLRLAPDGSYQIAATLGAALVEQAHLKELLDKAGVRKQDGTYHLTLSGTLRPGNPGGTAP